MRRAATFLSLLAALYFTLACSPDTSRSDENRVSDAGDSQDSGIAYTPPLEDDLEFLRDFCGGFASMNECLEANNQSPTGGWRCYNEAKKEVSCWCGWGEGFRVNDTAQCEAERVVIGCRPEVWDYDRQCDGAEREVGSCDFVAIGEREGWVTLGFDNCSSMQTPDGDSTDTCFVSEGATPKCTDCTKQLVLDLCE